MHSAYRSIATFAAAGLAASLGGLRAQAAAPQEPTALAILNLDYVDTSGEPIDQMAAHQRRARDFVSALRRDLAANGQYRIVPMSYRSAPCDSAMDPSELQKAAGAAGVKLVLLGGVHKMSSLVQWAKIQIADAEQGRIVFDRLLTFRGDTDEAWQKAESFVARDVLQSAPTLDKSADVAAPVRIAVFDFELEDFSGGAGLIPESEQDREQLKTSDGDSASAACRIWADTALLMSAKPTPPTCPRAAFTNVTVVKSQSLANSALINPLWGS